MERVKQLFPLYKKFIDRRSMDAKIKTEFTFN